jgi:hypothetical protein
MRRAGRLPDECLQAVESGCQQFGSVHSLSTHELIEASDLLVIADRANGIACRPPGG